MIEEKCYLCEKTVVKLIGRGSICTEKLLCSDCIDKLEKETAELIRTKNEIKERLDSFIQKYGSDENQ